jgi:hypothetical protein
MVLGAGILAVIHPFLPQQLIDALPRVQAHLALDPEAARQLTRRLIVRDDDAGLDGATHLALHLPVG